MYIGKPTIFLNSIVTSTIEQFDIPYNMISEKSLEWCIEFIKKFWQVQSRNHDMIKNDSDMEENFLTV